MIAPARSARPGAGWRRIDPPTADELETCPFCEGREDRTPPETFAVGDPDRAPDTPGWRVRVVPNLYPALERQEVVIHSPRHVRSLAELDEGELSLVAEAWIRRAEAAREEGFAYAQLLVNEGRDAGASLPHSHSQVAWFRDHPPAPASERTAKDDCAVCELVAHEVERGRLPLGVAEAEGLEGVHGTFVALCHPAGRAPYEVIVAPVEHEPEPWGLALEAGLGLVTDALRRLHKVEGPVPVNIWLHCAAFGEDGHWHIELMPRVTVLAGLELGAGVFINPLPPEQAAEALRQAAAKTA